MGEVLSSSWPRRAEEHYSNFRETASGNFCKILASSCKIICTTYIYITAGIHTPIRKLISAPCSFVYLVFSLRVQVINVGIKQYEGCTQSSLFPVSHQHPTLEKRSLAYNVNLCINTCICIVGNAPPHHLHTYMQKTICCQLSGPKYHAVTKP